MESTGRSSPGCRPSRRCHSGGCLSARSGDIGGGGTLPSECRAVLSSRLLRSPLVSAALHALVLATAMPAVAHPWARIYDGQRDDALADGVPTPGGGLVVVGETASWGAGGKDGWVL